MGKYLIESALLGQGLPGITEEELESLWPENPDGEIAWMKAGTLITGGISKFVRFRKETENCARICYQNFETAAEQKRTGFLTASGTMKACEKLQVPFAVSCGIGGLKTQQTIESCHDLLALKESRVSLIAASPKDMFDLEHTLKEAQKEGIYVSGCGDNVCNGYLFLQNPVEIPSDLKIMQDKNRLLLRKIPKKKRIQDDSIFEQALRYAKEAEKRELLFHPSFNQKVDELTEGYSSRVQLEALILNIRWLEENVTI